MGGENREFLTRTYPTMKKHNPSLPIMLREAQGTLPRVYARYEFGQEKSRSLEGMVRDRHVGQATGPWMVTWLTHNIHATGLSDKQIEDAVTTLVKEGGA